TNVDLMKVGGYKLSPLEIEAILLEHPVVSECCVLGLPDKTYREDVTAIVVPDVEIKKVRDNGLKPVVTLDELSKQKLAPHKVALYQLIFILIYQQLIVYVHLSIQLPSDMLCCVLILRLEVIFVVTVQ
nr:malonate--CoA ligase [Tanacetum cinerariifolium]